MRSRFITAFAAASFAAATASAQPRINNNGVVNAAAGAPVASSGWGIAKGSVLSIQGKGLGPATAEKSGSYPLVTDLAGTSVRVEASGMAANAFVRYTSDTRVDALLPSGTPEGPATITVTYNGQTSKPESVRVVRTAFGIYNAGAATAILNVGADGATEPNTLLKPAAPGQNVILHGTGLGAHEGDEVNGPGAIALPSDLKLFIGGKEAGIVSHGAAECCAGTETVTVTVPQGVQGCYVPVVAVTGDVVGNFAALAVSTSGGCTDVTGITSEDMNQALASGTFRLGSIDLSRTSSKMSIPGVGSMDSKTDHGSASFMKYEVQALTAPQTTGSGYASLGACTVLTFASSPDHLGALPQIRTQVLDAGASIGVVGPKGSKRLEKDKDGYYSAELGGGMSIPLPFPVPGLSGSGPDFLEPGEYTIENGSGGSGPDAVGAFTVRMKMPQMLTWTNQDSIERVTRSAGQEVTWSGGDSDGYVHISGMSSDGKLSAMFFCNERTSAGRFQIPGYVLLSLPQTGADSFGSLTVSGNTAGVKFSAQGLDAGYVTASSASQKQVSYR